MSALWDWAVAAYARPGVEALCLRLQDEEGQSIPFLLWAAWLEAAGRAAPPPVLAQAVDTARRWEGEVVGPLRGVRRRLKRLEAEALRQQVKAAELDAERALMTRLEALATAEGAGALAAAAAAWDPPARTDGVSWLALRLGL